MDRHDGHDVAAGEVIVKLRDSSPIALGRLYSAADADGAKALSHTGGLFRVHSRSKRVQALLDALRTSPDVEYVEPNYIVHTEAAPNDSYYSSLWALKNTAQSILGGAGTAGADISASLAWDVSKGSTANVVGVIDTGIDYNHPDLAPNMWSAPAAFTVTVGGQSITCPAGSHGLNAITDTCDPMDDHQHGTHVAGTIGAAGNNSSGVAGVNWTTRILGLKFMDSTGSGSVADAITAIDFAIQVKARFGAQANVRVLSNSWGGVGYSQALADAITRANTAEMLFVVAAGNSGQNNDLTPSYPASYKVANVLTVAATDNRDALANFSNYGAATVHLGAPGVGILSTVPGGGYAWMSGTSMATPHVAGAAMLVLSQCSLNTAALRTALVSNVDADPALTGRTVSGGRLNINRALRSCAGGAGSPTQNTAAFVKTDITTQGDWTSAYGSDGYTIQADGTQLPSYAQLSLPSVSRWTWTSSTTDPRALQKSAASDRLASTWYSSGSFSYDVNLTDGNAHQVAVYAVDWDHGNRSERIDILDGAAGTVLDSRTINLFSNGVYIVWSLKGHVVIRVTYTGGANAVLSGIFFGSGGRGTALPSAGATATFLRTDTTTQGSWSGVYGRDGYEIEGYRRAYPAYAAVSTNAPSAWTWAGTTTDVRALQKPGAADRIASCWYGSTYNFDVNLTDGGLHQVALYLLDWDNRGRAEKVEVLDAATGAALDTRSVSGFGGGQYLVWIIGGHVRVRVTLQTGSNAVVSGLFFN